MSISILAILTAWPPFDQGDNTEPDDHRDIPTAFASTILAADDWPDPLYATIEDD